ncbi:pyridoxal-dependent decarboxylase domain protein (macronuclear) [Tetrahymena thermophila SB210]|uniref:Pyridoxal-dependent decarboxylase domain protein n=1 Tax=Tetrahymena thermophila (strain SB210) TaxID=312017 RepID=I7LVK0_TETTS|nr:pyridoxal-dependent decarboxylase domain protein [Tetrahymena thermophila SB210]EAR98380.2 pyridoxal-dependent decarboxylase domain protein [Tetrahymena thermophila SB210]|eukprot:XP_001018625.2 pyridoxal-dependent decarboxylase domain protein [Tetrahymena thermophila SB210]
MEQQDQHLLANDKKLNEKFLDDVFQILKKIILECKTGNGKVIDFKTPDQLIKEIDLTLPLKGQSDEEIINFIKLVDKYSVKTSHSHFFNNLFGGSNEYSLAGDYFTSTINGSMYTYEMAPVFNFMENAIQQLFAERYLKWSTIDGVFCPGGSQSNFYGILAARQHKYPEFKRKGLRALPDLKLFTSELAHYSIEKGAIMLGFGLDSVVKIACDEEGRMIPEEFEKEIQKCIQEGSVPLMVNLTCGTTVFGVVDPINKCTEIAQKYNMWVHIDGCWGGHLIFLEEFRNKYSLISQADSFAWDAHKLFNVPQQCTAFFTRHVGLLHEANALGSDYLFMKDKKLYDATKYDSGDKTYQCARHIDVFKFWIYWKHFGTLGLEQIVADSLETTKYFAQLVKDHPNCELINEPEYVSVSFFYYPDSFLKRKELGEDKTEKFWEDMHNIPPIIKAKMVEQGTMMVAYQKQNQKSIQRKNFFRFIFTADKGKEEAQFALNEIHRLGKDL